MVTNGHDPRVVELKQRGSDFMKNQNKLVGLGAMVVIVLIALSKAVAIIPAGTVGIVELFGKVSDHALNPGFHLVNPLADVHQMSIRIQKIDEVASVPSKEGLMVALDVTLRFKLQPEATPEIYKTLRDYKGVLVVPLIRSVVRGATASFDAEALYTSGRELIALKAQDELFEKLGKHGIVVQEVMLRDVKLPQQVTDSIEDKYSAKQQAEKMIYLLDKEKLEADRKVLEARGIADFQRTVSEGLTPSFLKWKGIEATRELAESKNAKIVVVGSGKDGLPLILGGD